MSREKAHNPWTVLSVMLVGAFMALLDVTIVNVALPDIQSDIGVSNSGLEWIISAYALAFGLVLIPAGRFGDNYGHKLTFLAGLIVFTLASLGSGLSHGDWQIIAARAVQGIGAGIFVPAIRSAIRLLFGRDDQAKAFSALGAVIGASSALGPLFGGVLVEYAGWRWVFFVNVPVGLVLFPLAWRWLPSIREPGPRHSFDPVGIALLTAGLVLVLFPLVEGQSVGWPVWIWLALAGSAAAFAALWFWERRQEESGVEPIVPPRLLSVRSFGAGTVLAAFYFGAFTSIFFVFSLLWQQGLSKSPLVTGLSIIPFALASMVTSSMSHKLSAKLGRNVLFWGSGLVALGLTGYLLALHVAGTAINHWLLLGPFLAAGAGNGLFIAPNQDFIIASTERGQAGTASGVLSTAQRIGSAIGIAGVGTLFFGTLKAHREGGPSAFVHSAVTATWLNIGLVVVAFLLVFTLPAKKGFRAR